MVIIKTIGQDTFSWNPNAFNKRGHWFLLAETGSYIRIATKAEMSKLGKPKKEDEVQHDAKDVKKKKMSYQEAAGIRKKSLKNLITEKLIEGGGVGSSITGSISEKMKARTTGLKEKFDPLNIAKLLTGNLGSALLGKITGRSKEDIGYFAGDKKYKETKPKAAYVNEKLNKSDTALYSSIAEGNMQSMRKGDGLATIMARMYNLIKAQQLESLKRFQIEKNFKKIKEKEKEKWNKELIEALGGKKSFTIVKKDKKQEPAGNLFSSIISMIEDAVGKLRDWVSSLWNGLWDIVSPVIKVIGEIGGLLGLKSIFDKMRGIKGIPHTTTGTPETKMHEGKKSLEVPHEEHKTPTEHEKASEHKPAEHEGQKLKEEVKTKEEIKESAEKGKEAHEKHKEKKEHKEKAKKVEKTETKPKATKLSKAAKGAKGVLKFLGKIPFLAGVAGAAEMFSEIKDAIEEHEKGEITDKELKKKVAESVAGIMGGAAGAQLGATIGATVGSVVPVGGTLAGGAIGAIGGFFGGKKLGEYAAEKLFDKIANSDSEVEPKVTTISPEEKELIKSTEQPKEGVKKSKVPEAIHGATQSTPTATNTSPEPKAAPVPVTNKTDAKLHSSMSENMEMKTSGRAAVNTTVIDNSQNIGAAGGGDGGIMVDSSVSPRIDDPTLQRVHRQNLRPV